MTTEEMFEQMKTELDNRAAQLRGLLKSWATAGLSHIF